VDMSNIERRWPEGLPVGDGWRVTPATVLIRFPYDGTPVADAPMGSVEDAKAALQAASDVADAVAELPSRTRRAILLGVHDALADLRDEFEQLLVLETGKPLKDCRVEVSRTLVTLTAAAEEVARIHGETVPMDLLPSGDGLLGFWTRVPIGVVVGIAGFNYPLLLATHKIAPALAAGCPVVCKPAPQTPLATLWLVHLFRSAAEEHGVPASVVQLVTGDAEVGSALVTDPRVGAVSFTGSSVVGHRIARDAAPTKVLLELGSNAALIVAPDADLDGAADAVVRGGYYASGQACISVQRVIVAEPVVDEFLERVSTRLEKVVVGDPRREDTDVSALIDDRSTVRVEEWVGSAVTSGARVVAGGGREGTVLRPVVLADVPDGAEAWDEEIFGPVVCVRAVRDVEEAFDVANRSRYGLHASVWTTSLRTTMRAVRRLDVGGVIVNEVPGFRSDTMPYGGVKSSGTGREGPRFAIDELTVTKMAVIRWE
jgi:acyl-CoA reductase-like NAD-dependent aldehyde dehydrogenase